MNCSNDKADPSPHCRLRGKVAVITGGARGIGEAMARSFVTEGAHVVVADLLDAEGKRLCKEIGAEYVHCDVSVEPDVESCVAFAVGKHGALDIMVNNAAVTGNLGSIMEYSTDDVERVIRVNLLGVMHGIKHAAKAMTATNTKRGGGSIICVASSASCMGGLAPHAYTASKEGVVGIVRSSACELGMHRIRVNCISPHGVASPMLVNAYRKILGNDSIGVGHVLDMVAYEGGSLLDGVSPSAEDVARAALFLAVDADSRFITGHNLVVDGGFTSASLHLRRFLYST